MPIVSECGCVRCGGLDGHCGTMLTMCKEHAAEFAKKISVLREMATMMKERKEIDE